MIGHEKVYITQYGVTVEQVMAKYGSRYRLKIEDGAIQAPVGGTAKRLDAQLKLDAQIAGTGNWSPEYLAKRAEARAAKQAEAEWKAAKAEIEQTIKAEAERAAAIADLQDAMVRPEPATAKQIAYIARLIRSGAHKEGGYMVVRPDMDLTRLTRREASRIIDSLTGSY